MPREIDEAFVESAIRHYRRLEELNTVLREREAATEVTIRSGNGLVEIVVAADGSFRDLRIADSALHNSTGGELSRTVLAACQQAAHAATWAREKLAESLAPPYPSRTGS